MKTTAVPRKLWALTGLLLACATARAQYVTLNPNPVPLDGKLEIRFEGFPPYVPIQLWWDIMPRPFVDLPNVFLTGAIVSGPAGSASVVLDSIPLRVYPADVGRHTLVVGYLDLGPLGTGGWRYGQVPVEILPRTGWPSVQPLPTQPQTGLAGGVLGYFRYSADRSATSLVLTNGVQTKEVGSAAVPPLLIGGPAWSPDGSALAFSAVFDTTPYSNLYVLGPAGVSQITGYGGYPPRITGPGRGSLVGVLKMPETPPAPDTDPGEDACGELAQNIEPAKGMWVTLVGTGMVVPAFPDDPALGKNANYRYRFDNVPEGEYWLHAWFSTTICQGATISSTTRDAEGNLVPTTKHSRRPAGATPNTSVPVVVRAGIVTEVGNLTPLWTWQLASGPTWADAQTLMYTLYSGVYDRFGVALSDAWSVRIGDRPVQLSDTLKHGKVGDLAATLATGKLLWVEDNIGGLAVGDLANPAGTGAVVTSILARMSENLFPNDASPSWAPDGTHIAFIRSNVFESAGIGTISDPSDIAKIPILGLIGDVWIKNVATGAEKQLTRFRVSAGEGAVGRPAWSPDRSQIAVTYTRDNLRSTDIVVINVADGSEFAITNDGQSMRPAWRGTVGFNLQDLPAGIALEPGKQTIRVTPARRKGDTNGDGAVTTMDALLALRIGLGFQQGTAEQVASADLDGNGRVDVVDVARILRIAIGLEAG